VPRHRGIRRRRRRKDEELRVAELSILRAELRPLAEEAAIRLLADEADPLRRIRMRYLLDPRAVEVTLAEIAGAGCRAVGRIRDPDAFVQQVELLARLVEA
jgi:hypothetical protein